MDTGVVEKQTGGSNGEMGNFAAFLVKNEACSDQKSKVVYSLECLGLE